MLLALLCVGLFLSLLASWYWIYCYYPTLCDQPVPPALSHPPGSLADYYDTRQQYYALPQVGGPQRDGPDPSMPDTCFWAKGVLHCRPVV